MSPLVRKRILAGVLIALAVASLTGAGYYFWSITPPPMPDTIEEARAVMVSDRYARLPEERKRAYQERFNQLYRELPDDQRRTVREQMRDDPVFGDAAGEARWAALVSRAREWWLAPPDQRDAVMDRHLEEWGQRRNRGQGGRPQNGDRPQRPEDTRTEQQREADRAERRNRMREGIEDRFENGNPQEQAMIGEYFRSRRERSQNRR